MLKKIVWVVLGLMLMAIWWGWPIYQFYAHRGEVPFLFGDELVIESYPAPSQEIYQPKYNQAASLALAKLDNHHKMINAPGISAAISIDGELVWLGVAGWADVKQKIAVSTATQFRIGSSSKAVTATGLARLLDNQVIELDASISQYHKALPNPQWQQIKVKHLASHMSGLPHYKQFEDKVGLYKSIALNTAYADVNDSLSLFDQTNLGFTAGSQFSYSTYGTVLLSAVMQAAANQPFLELMQQQVFSPAGLKFTGAESNFARQGNLATFYWNNRGKNSAVRQWREVDLSHRLAGGGFVSTPSDLARLGNLYFDEQFISEKTKQLLWIPQRLTNGDVNLQNYAIGWRVHQTLLGDKTVTYIHHGGVSRGAQSFWVLIPDHKLSLAVNINANTENFADFAKIWKNLASAFIDAKQSM